MGLLNGLKKLANRKRADAKKIGKAKRAKKKSASPKKTAKKAAKKTAKKAVKKAVKKAAKKAVSKPKTRKPKGKNIKRASKKSKIVKRKISRKPKKIAAKRKPAKKNKKSTLKKAKKITKASKEKSVKFEGVKKISKANALKLVHRKDATEFIQEISGEEGYLVFEYLLKAGKDVDEFTLADKVGLQINFVRSLLYRLYEHKLVSFSRERDKKKGWFIYSWLAHPERLRRILLERKDEEIVRLKHQALTSQQVFYCNNCNKSYSYSDAIENMFFCPVCGSSLEALDVEKVKERVSKKVNQIIKEKNEIKAL